MKNYFIIAINTDKGIRFIDDQDSDFGTANEDSAKEFDTEEEANEFIEENEYQNCSVREFKEPTFNVTKSYESKPSKNNIEEKEVSLEKALQSLNVSEMLWRKNGGLIVERTEFSLTVEELDGSETITWTIEEN